MDDDTDRPLYAHSRNGRGRGRGRAEPIREHLTAVAASAEAFAEVWGGGPEARVVGLLHDLGKYGEAFQRRLRGEESGVDHWSVGAAAAWLQTSSALPADCWPLLRALECSIRGHHVGLQMSRSSVSIHSDLARQELRDEAARLVDGSHDQPERVLIERFTADSLPLPKLTHHAATRFSHRGVSGMLDTRMLFSALVDADYLETEAHFAGDARVHRRPRPAGPTMDAEAAEAVLDAYLADAVAVKGEAAADVAAVRAMLRADCLDAADGPRGPYTLTAPTGSGKTLAMLAFALRHARRHRRLRRIVCVIPFLSIIEQTAAEYRKVLASLNAEWLIEDHSRAGDASDHESESDGQGRGVRPQLLAENYDAPLVVCTSVQLLESLFADRPRRCRKLHRLANSVLMLDEVQTLPPELAVPTLAAVSRLVERYGCTAVFATATQPAFDHLHDRVAEHARQGWRPREIVRDTAAMFGVARRRTRVLWRLEQETPWWSLADELARPENSRSLCVLNLKRHAQKLVELLGNRLEVSDGLFHLSTNLCPAHRDAVLTEVRRRLKEGQPCLLISTQCIEAGVDVSFDRCYRALAPLDAIAQAAGRCNRGGLADEPGEVVVFVPERLEGERFIYPPGYDVAAEHCRTFVTRWRIERGEDAAAAIIHDPAAMREYFRTFYDLSGKAKMKRELAAAFDGWDFKEVARRYRLIAGDTVRVLVPYDLDVYHALRDEAVGGLDPLTARLWFCRASPFGVNLYRPALVQASALMPVSLGNPDPSGDGGEADWYILEQENRYDRDRLGLVGVERDLWIA